MSMAATSRMFGRLKTTPPTNADPSQAASACRRSARKLRPPPPTLPAVNASSGASGGTLAA